MKYSFRLIKLETDKDPEMKERERSLTLRSKGFFSEETMLCARHFNKTAVSPADDVKVTELMETKLMWHEQMRSIIY